tara:strand:+ start:2908 stop:3264 length:357 start_codon:yes stop_codon:yes gene_type:complete
MANTIASGTIASTLNANDWGGLFSHVYTFTSTISDNDAVAQHAHGVFAATVTGVALGDMVIGVAITNDLKDSDDVIASASAQVSATNTVQVIIDVPAAYNLDDLNTAVIKLLVARPTW